MNIGSGSGAAAPAGGAAAAGGAAEAAPAAEEKKEEGKSHAPGKLRGFVADKSLQRRRSPTRTWASVCSTKRLLSSSLGFACSQGWRFVEAAG